MTRISQLTPEPAPIPSWKHQTWLFPAQTASQALSSINNLILTLVVVSVSSIEGLGNFNLPFTIYLAAVGIHRALIIDSMLASINTSVFIAGQKVSLYLSSATALFLVGIGWIFDHNLIIIFGAFIPVLLLYDLRRNWAIVTGNPHASFCMDFVWVTGTLCSPLLAGARTEYIVVVWGSACFLALLTSCLFGLFRRRDGIVSDNFWVSSRGISAPSALEAILFQFGWQLPVALALDQLSTSLAGEYRLVVTIFGPLAVLVTSWTLGTYRTLGNSDAPRRALVRRVVGIAVLSTAYWSLCLLLRVLMPELLNEWGSEVSVFTLAVVGLQVPITSITSQLSVWFKRERQTSALVKSRSAATLLGLAFVGVAFWREDGAYAISALTAALTAHSGIVWIQYLRRSEHKPSE